MTAPRARAAALGLTVLLAAPARGYDLRVATLVEAGPARWPAVPPDARIDLEPLSFRRKEFLKPAAGIPIRDPAVARALAAALTPVPKGERQDLKRVLDALEAWAGRELTEEPGPVAAPVAWRDAAAVLRDRRGNGFELVRALVALCRAAGIPARPSFNGVPVTVLYATPRRGPGAWTVWDPIHPSGSARVLPVLWLPLRAAEVAPVAVKWPPGVAGAADGRLVMEGRRLVDEAAARAAFASLKATGAFPPADPPALPADAAAWWEVWSIGISGATPPPPGTALRVPLPYVKELGYGTREHAVWTSDPARPPAVTAPQAETDQDLGGILMTIAIRL